jgi:hypothetical protein
MAEPVAGRSWWTTLPGVLTGVAALLTAVTGFVAVIVPLLQGRAEPAPPPPRTTTTVIPAPGQPTSSMPASLTPPAIAPGPGAAVPLRPAPSEPARPDQGHSGARQAAPALSTGSLTIADATFEVLKIESEAGHDQMRHIRVTFRVAAGETTLNLARGNVRILAQGQIHTPVEGLPAVAVPAGTSRQFWVRFEIAGPVRTPVLSFTDDMLAPRGEVRLSIGAAIPEGPEPLAGPPPPLLPGHRHEIAGASFEVLSVEELAARGDLREISVTFVATAGGTPLGLARSNVRILTPGRIHTPVEGFAAVAVPAGTSRRFWARFEIPGPARDMVLSLTDDMLAPRGEIHGALPLP